MSDDEETPAPWRNARVVLETGGWWEVLPDDIPHFMARAKAYVASKNTNPEAAARVKAVWLDHEYRPAWQRRGPPPPPRMGGTRLAQTASAVVDSATGEVIDDEAPF